jgi:signal transduction histidine kinase
MTAKILIVDDEASGLATLESILDGEGYQLEFAQNGETALAMAEKIQPDLILLDVMMPGMDGFEVCRRIRSAPTLAEIPIVILTALDDYNSRLIGLDAGADDFFSKPMDRHELRARVKTITRLNRYRTLMRQREQLREMAGRTVEAQERERQRISRELHDDLGQALTAHILNLQNLQNDLPLAEDALRTQLNNLLLDTAGTLDKMRLMAQDLRPPALDTLGLRAALENYSAEFSARARIPLTFEAEPEVPEISDVIAITLYRFLQEALTNIARHARAHKAWVEFAIEGNEISLTVQDNGAGFDPAAKTNGIGITGLRERVTLAGGRLFINSAPGRGTIIAARLPMADDPLQSEAI